MGKQNHLMRIVETIKTVQGILPKQPEAQLLSLPQNSAESRLIISAI